jgi:coenzyme Q-binding protein COQ10
MPRHAETKILPYTPEQMFDLVADVAKYPQFLPWMIGARIRSRTETDMVADLIIGFRIFRESFTSKVTFARPERIHVDYVSGPLKYLKNEWAFVAVDGGCRVDFQVDFQFQSRMFETLVGALFTEAVRRMVAAFEKRAAELYAGEPRKIRSAPVIQTSHVS